MNQQLHQLRTELHDQFPERGAVIDGVLASVISGEHCLLIGPPGTGKSALARTIATAFGASYFEFLLSKFSVPEELFGPISLRSLEADQFRRVTTGRLPEVEIAFLDEIFKANAAILNSLLGVLNERKFSNGDTLEDCPLVSVVAASNELPQSDLGALRDRFLLTFELLPVIRDASFRKVVAGAEPAVSTRLDMQALRQATWSASKVVVPDAVMDGMLAIRESCRCEGLTMSDRRWKRSLRLIRTMAFMHGEKTAGMEDLGILADVLWFEPRDRSKAARLVGAVADPTAAKAIEILDAAKELEAKIASLRGGSDRRKLVSEAAATLDQFRAQEAKLASLAGSAGRRAKQVIGDATREITALREDLARAIGKELGVGAGGA